MIKTKAFILSIGYGGLVALFCYCVMMLIGLLFNGVSTFFGWEHFIALLISCLIVFPGVGHLYVRHQPFSNTLIWLTSGMIAVFGVLVSVFLGQFLLNLNGLKNGSHLNLNDHGFLWILLACLLAIFLARGALHFYFYYLKRSGILSAFTEAG